MKTVSEHDYAAALAVANALNYFPIAVTDESEENTSEIVLASKANPNPEKMAIKKDNFAKLSVEAQQIIMLIVWGPIDFFENIETKHFRKVTLRKVRSYFGKQYGKKRTSFAIKEIQEWVNNL